MLSVQFEIAIYVRFITPHYQEKFRIPDGDKIRIRFRDGELRDRICRYIDDYRATCSATGL